MKLVKKFIIKNKLLGFTLVELLVVIAIIGTLSAVAIVNLNIARNKAHEAAVIKQLNGLTPAIILCLDDDKPLACNAKGDICNVKPPDPPEAAPPEEGGFPICAGSLTNWPDLSEQKNWEYQNVTSNVNSDIWYISFKNGIEYREGVCTEEGCVVVDVK